MIPTVTTDRLVLVPFCRADVDVLHALWTDPGVRRYLWDDMVIPRRRAAETVEAALATADAAGVGMWSIRLLDQPDIVIGFCGLRFLPDGKDVELLYGLLPQFWRRGLATEASSAVLRYAFGELGLPRIFAGADAPNARSFGVMERLGMTPVPDGISGVPGAVYYVRSSDLDSRQSSVVSQSLFIRI